MAGEEWLETIEATLKGCTEVTLKEAITAVRSAIAAGGATKHAADLALAFAVGKGDPVATARFVEWVDRDMRLAARAIDGDGDFVDEICQLAHVRLMVGENSSPPRIASYRGTGALRAWTAIAVQRIALNAKRRQRREPDASVDVLAELACQEPDQELRHLKTLYRTEFRDALSAVLLGLEDRRRAVLRLRFVDGLELAEIGRLYDVHESTVSRWISATLVEVSDNTRKNLISSLSVSPQTADSIARMVQSQLDLSVARLLH